MEVPFFVTVRNVARGMGIPPWQLEHPDRPPSEAETSVWFFRERFLTGLGM